MNGKENFTQRRRDAKFYISNYKFFAPSRLCVINKCNKSFNILKTFEIIGEFSCLGLDTIGPLKLVGGINKGHPDEKDLDDARKFAIGLKNRAKFTEIMGS